MHCCSKLIQIPILTDFEGSGTSELSAEAQLQSNTQTRRTDAFNVCRSSVTTMIIMNGDDGDGNSINGMDTEMKSDKRWMASSKNNPTLGRISSRNTHLPVTKHQRGQRCA
jgi:hypothetical protein